MVKKPNNRLSGLFILVLFLSAGMASADADEMQTAVSMGLHHRIRDGRLHVPDSLQIFAFSIAATGDLMLGGSALPLLKSRGSDAFFDSTRVLIQRADIAVANLEAPFASGGEPFEKTFTFQVPCSAAAAVKRAGLDVLTLANNHIMDYGEYGLLSTIACLDSLSLAWCGAGRNREEAEKGVVLHAGPWTIGFFAFSLTYPEAFWAGDSRPGTAYPRLHTMKQRLWEMGEQTDFVIVSFHWGAEKRDTPKSYQQYYARLAIDWGADLVIGHHPHVIQGIEIYKSRPIAYSMGNYAFGSWSTNSRQSAILKIWFDRKAPILGEWIPIDVYNARVEFNPRPLRSREREQALETMDRLSAPLNPGKMIWIAPGLFTLPAEETNEEET